MSLRKALTDADVQDDKLFHTLVAAAMRKTNLSEDALALEFNLSVPTARRWANGTSSPHPALRATVYKRLAELLPDDPDDQAAPDSSP